MNTKQEIDLSKCELNPGGCFNMVMQIIQECFAPLKQVMADQSRKEYLTKWTRDIEGKKDFINGKLCKATIDCSSSICHEKLLKEFNKFYKTRINELRIFSETHYIK